MILLNTILLRNSLECVDNSDKESFHDLDLFNQLRICFSNNFWDIIEGYPLGVAIRLVWVIVFVLLHKCEVNELKKEANQSNHLICVRLSKSILHLTLFTYLFGHFGLLLGAVQ